MNNSIKSKSLLMALALVVGLSAVPVKPAQAQGTGGCGNCYKKITKPITDLYEFLTATRPKDLTRQMYNAAHAGNHQAIQSLLEARAQVNSYELDDHLRMSILHEIAMLRFSRNYPLDNHLKVMQLLINARANINAKNTWGETPIWFTNNSRIARQLIKARADVAIKSHPNYPTLLTLTTRRRNTPEYYATIHHLPGALQGSLHNAILYYEECNESQPLIEILKKLKPEAKKLQDCLPKNAPSTINIIQEYLHGPVNKHSIRVQLSLTLQKAIRRKCVDLINALTSYGVPIYPKLPTSLRDSITGISNHENEQQEREYKMAEAQQRESTQPLPGSAAAAAASAKPEDYTGMLDEVD